MAVVVQESDAENIIAGMNRLGIPITRLPSVGGFLEQKNITLLAGVPEGKEGSIKKAISSASKNRVEFLPGETDQNDQESVVVSKATIFTFDVERYEEI